MCNFVRFLVALTNRPCMQHHTFGSYVRGAEPHLPTYVVHSPHLVHRRRSILENLERLAISSVTLVACANRDDINALHSAERACIYSSTFNPFDKRNTILQNGTISLALKHKIAYADIVQRRIERALVLEDDAYLPMDFWKTLSSFRIPTNADIFYLGSYSKFSDWNVLKWDPPVLGSYPRIHKRDCRSKGRMNKHLGAISYVIYYKAAAQMIATNIKVTPDSALSAMPCNWTKCSFCKYSPTHQYGPSRWVVYPRKTLDGSNTHRY